MKSVFLRYRSQRDVHLFCKFRMTFTWTKNIEKSSYLDRDFLATVRKEFMCSVTCIVCTSYCWEGLVPKTNLSPSLSVSLSVCLSLSVSLCLSVSLSLSWDFILSVPNLQAKSTVIFLYFCKVCLLHGFMHVLLLLHWQDTVSYYFFITRTLCPIWSPKHAVLMVVCLVSVSVSAR